MRRAGVVVGLAGVAELIYGFVSAPAGRWQFQVTGLILGALLFFSGLGLQAAIRWLAFLFIPAQILTLLAQTVLVPGALLAAQWRMAPAAMAAYHALPLLMLALALFVARQLSLPEVLDARRAAGRKMRAMRWPLALGVLLGLGGAVFQYAMLHGEDARRARQMAADKLGPRYQYFTNGVWVHAGKDITVTATVQAWNDKELLQVPLHWKK